MFLSHLPKGKSDSNDYKYNRKQAEKVTFRGPTSYLVRIGLIDSLDQIEYPLQKRTCARDQVHCD